MFPLKVTYYNLHKLRNGFLKEKHVPEQSADVRTSMFVFAAILRSKTVFLSNDFWSPWWKFNTLIPSILPRLLPVNRLVQKRGWIWSQSCKTQPTFLEIHGCWHRFPARSSLFLFTQADSVHLRNVIPHVFFFFALLSNCFCNPKSPNQSKVVLFIQRSKSSVWYNCMLSLRDPLRQLIFITRPLPENHEGCRLKTG